MCSRQGMFRRVEQTYFANHVIERKQAMSERECGMYCVRYELCASSNYKISGVRKGLCELNNKTLKESSSDARVYNPEFNHLAVIKPVSKKFISNCL